MKKFISFSLLAVCIVLLASYAPVSKGKPVTRTKSAATTTYNVRLGYKNLNGSVTLTGSTDSPGFTAYELETGEYYDCSLPPSDPGTFLPHQLPGIMNDLPAGTYEFTAERGQGNWVGYGTVTVTLSPELVGPDGYINVYVPIAWEE